MGLLLGSATLFYTFKTSSNRGVDKDRLFTAAMFGSVYWISGLSAILYPGAKGMDPEFGEGFPQFWLFLGLGAASWIGWWLESRNNSEGSLKVT